MWINDLLGAPPTEDPRVRSAPRTRDGMTFWALNQHPDGSGQHAFKIRLDRDRREPCTRTHEGREWLYVLSGRLRLVLGENEFVLERGEAAEFSTWAPHWMGALDGPAEVIAIFGPHASTSCPELALRTYRPDELNRTTSTHLRAALATGLANRGCWSLSSSARWQP